LSSRSSFDPLVKIVVALSQVITLLMMSVVLEIFDEKLWAVHVFRHHELSPAGSAQDGPHLAAIAKRFSALATSADFRRRTKLSAT
jgi:hypothetical protein